MSTINLLPEDFLQRRAQQRANILCLILFSVVMGGVIAAAVLSEEQARQTRVVRDQVNHDYEEAGRLIAQLQQLEDKKRQVLQKAQVAADLRERVPRSCLLACITNALPAGTSLRDLTVETSFRKSAAPAANPKLKAKAALSKDPAAEKKPERVPTDVTISIMGMAQNDMQVAQFIAAMGKNPLMASVDLGYSEETKYDDVVVREFRVTMTLKPDAEMELQPGLQPAAGLADAK